MSVDEIRNIALGKVPMHYKQAADGFVVLDDIVVRNALLAYAAMVERCENLLKDYDLYGLVSDANKQKCDLLRKHVNYILKGAINGTKH